MYTHTECILYDFATFIFFKQIQFVLYTYHTFCFHSLVVYITYYNNAKASIEIKLI